MISKLKLLPCATLLLLGLPAYAAVTPQSSAPIASMTEFQRTNTLVGSSSLQQAALAQPAVVDASSGQPAKERKIKIEGNGAAADFGPHHVGFASSLNTPWAVDMVMADGQRLRSHILGLAYYDPTTGQSVLLANLKDCQGELLPPNQIIYRNAFDGASADVVYTYTETSMEQDIVIRKQLPAPSKYSLNAATTRLAVLTEFLNPPVPRKLPSTVDLRALNQAANIQGEDTLGDESILFNTMRIGLGKAFTLGDSSAQIPVGKSWQKLEGRDFLVESTPYALLKPQLDNLPPETASLTPRQHKTLKQALLQASVPAKDSTRSAKPFLLAQGPLQKPGVVLDYLIVSAPLLNINFGGATTNKIGFAAVGQTTNDYWNGYNFPGITPAAITNLKWSDTNNSGAGVTVVNGAGQWGNGVADGMYGPYIYSQAQPGSITVTLTNVPSGTYDFYVYGHSPTDADNGTFTLTSGTTNYGTNGTTIYAGWNSTNWEEGQQYVTFRSVSVVSTQSVVLTVLPDHAGYPILCGLQMVLSSAITNSTPPIASLIDINFGTNTAAKVGKAAVGLTTSDVWNGYNVPGSSALNSVANLKWSDGYTSAVGLTVTNAPGVSNNLVADGMYGPYIYAKSAGNILVTLTNLANGTYDFYVYGHSGTNLDNGVYQLTCGTNSYVTKGTTIWGAGWKTTVWEESQQYVVFRAVSVMTNQPVVFTVQPDASGYALISGLQVVLPMSSTITDSDGDGIPDWWEIQYGLNPHDPSDASADPDGDGWTNLQEYQNGTNPHDPNDLGLHVIITNPRNNSILP